MALEPSSHAMDASEKSAVSSKRYAAVEDADSFFKVIVYEPTLCITITRPSAPPCSPVRS